MTNQEKGKRQILAPRVPLLNDLVKAQSQLADRTGMLLLNFWGSRGSGRTTFLQAAQKRLLRNPEMSLAGEWDASLMNVAELSTAIRNAISVQKGKYKLVLIDNLDSLLMHDADGSDFFEFESKVILPLVEKEDTLIVTGSQIEITLWQEYDVRVRQENHQLPPMKADEIKEVLQGESINEQRAYEITFGQPKMLELYMAHPDWTEKEISQHAREYFLEGFTDEIKELAYTASLLPLFNTFILRKIQKKNTADNNSLLMAYNDQVNELTRRWIVRYDTQVGAYRFTDSSVRRLLAQNFKLQDPTRFEGTHKIIADYFMEEAGGVSYLSQVFVSAIYHLAQSKCSLPIETRGATCLEWIKTMKLTWLGARWDQVLKAWETGAGDYATREELTTLIGSKSFSKITAILTKNNKAEV
jgi:hypothetical protein